MKLKRMRPNVQGYKRCAPTLGTQALLRLDSLSDAIRFQSSYVNVISFAPTRNARPYMRRNSRNLKLIMSACLIPNLTKIGK
jgi:hypothetical protein